MFEIFGYDKDNDTYVLLGSTCLGREQAVEIAKTCFAEAAREGAIRNLHGTLTTDAGGEPFDWLVVAERDGEDDTETVVPL